MAVIASSAQPALVEAFAQAGGSVHMLLTPLDKTAGKVYDMVILAGALEQAEDPVDLLKAAGGLLADQGMLLIVTAAIARARSHQLAARDNCRHSFTIATMQMALEKSGFHEIYFPAAKQDRVPLAYISARKNKRAGSRKLSIIVPVYNEGPSVRAVLESVLAKQVDGIAGKEVIIVESNSSDGSREVVQGLQSHPEVKIVLEEAPRGKGHAVRAGLAVATGDIVLIQDADDEYDINDYDALVAPLLKFETPFVLGSRHQGSWKIRKFKDQSRLGVLLNFGHILFAGLINLLYGQRMNDPFTMYKVFRRECIYGLFFECNRFDFDHELVIKLVRKGYVATELPVTYRSRSFSEGKKINIFRCPLLWLKADFKYRFASPFARGYSLFGKVPEHSEEAA